MYMQLKLRLLYIHDNTIPDQTHSGNQMENILYL